MCTISQSVSSVFYLSRQHGVKGCVGGSEDCEGPVLSEETNEAGELESRQEGGEDGVEEEEVVEGAGGAAPVGD